MASRALSTGDFRQALGHYPTGVAVVAATSADGSPVAMVVGTFTSVSLDPPLVGFLPDRKSTSWPLIREAGRFCVSVLGASQEQVCRAFATKEPDRFRHLDDGTGTRSPRIAGAALWVDCEIDAVHPAGDHDFVLGRVLDLGIGEPELPLLFLRGGYGAPHLPSVQAEVPGFAPQLRLADRVRTEAESVARDLGLECLVTAPAGSIVVVLAAAGLGSAPRGSDTRVGATFPLAAPFAAHFVAWASPQEQERWIADGERFSGAELGARAWAELDAVRQRGLVIATGHAESDLFQRSVFRADGAEHDGHEGHAEILHALRMLAQRDPEPGLMQSIGEVTDVVSMHVPVRDHAGRVVLALDLLGFTGNETLDVLTRCRDRLLLAADRATKRLVARDE